MTCTTPVSTPSRPIAYLCLALSMALWASYAALSKPLAAALPMFLLAWMRCGTGGLASGALGEKVRSQAVRM